MKKYLLKYRIFALLCTLSLVALGTIQLVQEFEGQVVEVTEGQTNDEKTLVLEQSSCEAVVPFFQVDIQQDFFFVPNFLWKAIRYKALTTIRQEYLHLLSYFVNLYTANICTNAP
ncbi:MAG: hypothetical protein GY827_12115 [Cytophagales bacterium]|nr:hypothetical protein [Cytophagales bacterium]